MQTQHAHKTCRWQNGSSHDGFAASRSCSRVIAMTGFSLRDLYEDPRTPLSSGSERAELQAVLLAKTAARLARPAVVLDVGCGDGAATAIAVARCKLTQGAEVTVVGLDWSRAALDLAHDRGIPVVRAALDGAGLPLADASVDVVIMSELIEHLVDTDGALEEVARVLVPGGTLLLSTPNLAAWYQPRSPRPRRAARLHRGQPPWHLRPPR